jgi:uncharacterized coiled-coil DUF342 family protein
MLTVAEVASIDQLIERTRPPIDGMERHFLRVIDGLALPCTPKEREWYEHWQSTRRTAVLIDDYRARYEEAVTLLDGREETIRVLDERVHDLEQRLSSLVSAHQESKEEAARLRTAHRSVWGEVEKREQEIRQLKSSHDMEVRDLKLFIAKLKRELGTEQAPSALTDQEKWERLPDGSGNSWREQA